MKVQISVDDELMTRVDNYADENYMSRSGLITLALCQYLNQQEAVKAVCDMAVSMRKIAETGHVTPDTLRDLEDMERLVKMCMGS